MISERLRRDGKPFVSRELIYLEYYRRQKLVLAGLSDKKLPLLPKRRKQRKTRDGSAKKYSRDAGCAKIRERVNIGQRPKNVLNRKRVGHWESDLINVCDGTGHIVTQVELKRIDSLPNDCQLRCLNWRTPRETFNTLLNRYLIAV